MTGALLIGAGIAALVCLVALAFWANDELAAAVEFEADAADYEPEPGGYWGDADTNPCLDPNRCRCARCCAVLDMVRSIVFPDAWDQALTELQGGTT